MRDFSSVQRVVVKIGTNVLRSDSGGIDTTYIRDIAEQVCTLVKAGKQVVIVTSGAIGMGASELGIGGRIEGVKLRQACAAVGQPILMNTYKDAFSRHNTSVAQVLLTREVLDNRTSYLNLRNAIETLLSLGVVPVVNENDCVSTAEIGTTFGDNDRLSALVASKVDAEVLILLSDIDALYDSDPRTTSGALPIRTVPQISDEVLAAAGSAGSRFGRGGMQSKLAAALVAENAGCPMLLAHGREPRVLSRLLAGEEIGTVFLAKRRLGNRVRWILNSEPQGRITIDDGALAAIRSKKSLLPTGIVRVEGVFPAGAVVNLNDCGKIVTSMSSYELAALAGKHSREIEKLLGGGRKEFIARPEDMVFFDEESENTH
ncbi:MAG: glutamate 5-kinase [Spirochaetaceae bacterium]|nr:MAG: glutamate 5-kinase [Spirochaetaceae bacterium]